jgi:hypothetical protein
MIGKNDIWLLLLACVLLAACGSKKDEKRTVFRYNEATGIASWTLLLQRTNR